MLRNLVYALTGDNSIGRMEASMERFSRRNASRTSLTVPLAMAFALMALVASLWICTQPATAYAANLATGSLDAAGATQIQTQSDEIYLDNERNIILYDKTSGYAAYDPQTKTITLRSVKASKLAVNIEHDEFELVLDGTSYLERVSFRSDLTVQGTGSIVTSKRFDVNVEGDPCTLTMLSGKIDSNNVYCGSLRMKGGAITVIDPTYEGIYVEDGDMVMTGGVITVTGAHAAAIDAFKMENGKRAGKVVITGGKLTAKVLHPGTKYAVWAGSMSNKVSSLVDIEGILPTGAKFKKDKNVYRVMDYVEQTAKLVKYNGGKTATINKVKYGKATYKIAGIGAGAFNTSAGKKVTSIAIKSKLSRIESKAFYGTKSLKTLKIRKPYFIKQNGKGSSLKLKVRSGCSVSKKAFTKCGKGGGKNLTVVLYNDGVKKSEASTYKSFLVKRGLPKSAKLRQY